MLFIVIASEIEHVWCGSRNKAMKGALSGCPNPLRQIIIKDQSHGLFIGRAKTTFVITTNRALTLVEALTVYARRWRIENKESVT